MQEARYTVITATGKVYVFYVKALAETYVQAYGGKLIEASILTEQRVIA